MSLAGLEQLHHERPRPPAPKNTRDGYIPPRPPGIGPTSWTQAFWRWFHKPRPGTDSTGAR